MVQEMVDAGVEWVIANSRLNHIVNLEQITNQFYAENEMLKYDQNLVKDFLKRGDELNLKNCKHVEDIELLYRKDHKHLTQYK